MSYRLAKSLVTLRNEVNDAYSGRPTGSDGWIGDKKHAATVSDHNPNSAGVVRAFDFTEWVQNGVEMNDVLAEHLRSRRDPRLKYIISDGQMFSSYATSSCRAWEWRPYHGPNGHFKHVHVSVHGDYDSTRSWGFNKPLAYSSTTPTQTPTGDTMTPAQEERIMAAIKKLDDRISKVMRDMRELGKDAGLELAHTNDTTDGKIES